MYSKNNTKDPEVSHSQSTLFDFNYPDGFRWSKDIEKCHGLSKYDGWNCGFLPLILDSSSVHHASNKVSIDIFKVIMKVIDLRYRKNHIVQIPIFGKLLELIARCLLIFIYLFII